MSNTDDEFLEDVLNEYARNLHEYSNGVPGHHNDYREQTDQAKQAIQAYIDEQVIAGRIDEIELYDNHCAVEMAKWRGEYNRNGSLSVLKAKGFGSPYAEKRLTELKERENSNE